VSINWRKAAAVFWRVFERGKPGGSAVVGGAGGVSLGEVMKTNPSCAQAKHGKVGRTVPETDDMAFLPHLYTHSWCHETKYCYCSL
jgi:hypothetical protein